MLKNFKSNLSKGLNAILLSQTYDCIQDIRNTPKYLGLNLLNRELKGASSNYEKWKCCYFCDYTINVERYYNSSSFVRLQATASRV